MSEEYYKNRCIKLDAKLDRVLDSHSILVDKIKQLEQENQQLKDRNKLLEKHYKQLEKDYGKKLDRNIVYKSVLDEIREYINTTEVSDDIAGILTLKECMYFDEILQILDKVKE